VLRLLRIDANQTGFTGPPREQVHHCTRWQIFLCDTNNVEIELNFETQDEVAA
jgi:3-phenylpropionate/cinnamic acid dioxygenase small subunit